MSSKPNRVLPLIILSQFACTSLWFAGNAIVDSLSKVLGFDAQIAAHMLSSVQLGFIAGTLIFAILLIVDRFSPSKVFLISAILAAFTNLPILIEGISTTALLATRFMTGFFLAGIYPVGMKMAADYFEKGLGKALGLLVGALVLGSATPYLIRGVIDSNNFGQVLWGTSILAIMGGLIVGFGVPEGPFRKPMSTLKLQEGFRLFKIPAYRSAAFGYFGHMWELYAFWAFTPVAIAFYGEGSFSSTFIATCTFFVIALGAVSCALGGYLSIQYSSKKVAFLSLVLSGLLCLLSPLLFKFSKVFFLLFWCLWGMAVTSDSPQFSTLVAQAVPAKLKGTALTLTNCIGFGISILGIQTLYFMQNWAPTNWLFFPLVLGPLFGILYFRKHTSNSVK